MLSTAITPDELDKLRYPLLVSPKYDGVRAYTDYMGDLRSRADRRFDNSSIYSLFGKLPSGLDGELVIGDSPGDTTSAVNSLSNAVFDMKFMVFDFCLRRHSQNTFVIRQRMTEFLLQRLWEDRPFLRDIVVLVKHQLVHSAKEALDFYEKSVASGYPEGEGIVLRDPEGIYKFGRSTLRQQYSIKVKEVETAEAYVVRLEPLMRNGTVQASLGAIVCKCRQFQNEFHIGTGFSDEQRWQLWRTLKPGMLVKFKYKIQGSVNAPIQPVYIGVSTNVSDF